MRSEFTPRQRRSALLGLALIVLSLVSVAGVIWYIDNDEAGWPILLGAWLALAYAGMVSIGKAL